jgi:O-antigen/teichoic acid export membrane protein
MFRPVAISFCLDRNIAREMVSFGGYLFISGLFTFLIFNLDNFIIGVVKGSKDLGYYAIAYNWSAVICGIM